MVYIHLICAVHCIAHLSARLAQPLTALAYSPSRYTTASGSRIARHPPPKNIVLLIALTSISNPNTPFPVFSLKAQGSPSEGRIKTLRFRDATKEEDQTCPAGAQDQLQSFW